MLKAYFAPLCTRLTALFNSSFSSGKVPSAWKLSRVTPIFKKGDSNLVENYRPISILSLVGKVQERLVHCTLLDHLLGRIKAISTSQFGFRLGRSTQEALISMTQSWHVNTEAGQSTVCIFLDLAKAFDSVSHFGIIDVLFRAGVSNPLFSWFRNEPAVADDLATIANRLTSRGFRLNIRKVKSMIVSHKKTPPSISLQLQGEQIQVVNCFRLLRVTITNNLLDKAHHRDNH